MNGSARDRYERAARAHVADLERLLASSASGWIATLGEWGATLVERLEAGGRLIACGNGGSAAEAQHLVAELVGHFDLDRPAWSAIALSADGVLTTAVANDYGADVVFARQVEGHTRRGDIVVGFSTSGRSRNVVTALDTAKQRGATTWAFTGAAPNPLQDAADAGIAVAATNTALVQEAHQLLVHLLMSAAESCLS